MEENTIRIPCERTSSYYGNDPAGQETPAKKTANIGNQSRREEPRPVVPSAQISLDFEEAVRHESLPLTPCQQCGQKFGSTSIVLHRKTCRSNVAKTRRKKKSSSSASSALNSTPVADDIAGEETKIADKSNGVITRTTLDLPNVVAAGVRVFGAPCKYCGERFGTHSLRLHMKTCRSNRKASVFSVESARGGQGGGEDRGRGRGGEKGEGRANSRSTTVGSINLTLMAGLGDLLVDHLSHHRNRLGTRRPQTRSLNCSVLVQNGFSLPTIEPPSTTNRAIVNKSSPTTVTRGEITFPSLHPRHQITTNSPSKPSSSSRKIKLKQNSVGRPPSVVCYICGREYGTNSISIHERQCLKKFETENRMLPINERKPLPKKPITGSDTLTPAAVGLGKRQQQQERVAIVGGYIREVLEATSEDYFQHCYSEWEKDLMPCKTCGRRFAPERHVKHAPKCKAKPLPQIQQEKQMNND